jgi:hypothetical protein
LLTIKNNKNRGRDATRIGKIVFDKIDSSVLPELNLETISNLSVEDNNEPDIVAQRATVTNLPTNNRKVYDDNTSDKTAVFIAEINDQHHDVFENTKEDSLLLVVPPSATTNDNNLSCYSIIIPFIITLSVSFISATIDNSIMNCTNYNFRLRPSSKNSSKSLCLPYAYLILSQQQKLRWLETVSHRQKIVPCDVVSSG